MTSFSGPKVTAVRQPEFACERVVTSTIHRVGYKYNWFDAEPTDVQDMIAVLCPLRGGFLRDL